MNCYHIEAPKEPERIFNSSGLGHDCDQRIYRQLTTNEHWQYYWRCVICGKPNGGAIAYAKLSDVNVRDARDIADGWENLWSSRKTNHYETQRQQHEDAEDDYASRWWAWYNGYLKGAIWEQRRGLVMHRARGRCEACGKARPTQVHHTTYDHVGCEPLWELRAVCNRCHDQLTGKG